MRKAQPCQPAAGPVMSYGRRYSLVTGHLLMGEGLTVAQVSEMACVSNRQAYRILNEISCVWPIVDEAGVWQLMVMREGKPGEQP